MHAPGHSDFMIAFFVVPFLGCVIAVEYIFLTTVLVQGQICQWWSGKGLAGQGEDAALKAFNHVRLPPNTCAAQA